MNDNDDMQKLAAERKELLCLVWALVRLRGGSVVLTEAAAADAMDERNRLDMHRDERGNVVLRAIRRIAS
jgi:hypothetical protein